MASNYKLSDYKLSDHKLISKPLAADARKTVVTGCRRRRQSCKTCRPRGIGEKCE
jgi:hypothetical protein